MGRPYLVKLEGKVYKCRSCHSHLTNSDELLSRGFHCRQGKAYLFNLVVNILVGPKEDRMMTTGLHTVSDLYCICCNQIVGWKYERAYERSQKYKEGKFILELARTRSGEISEFYSDSHPTSSDTEGV
eukprot:c21299_g1_i1 orf=334-717(-)